MTTVDQAALDPMSRDPRECGFGFFVTDTPEFGGAQGFMWFGTEADALAYLRTEMAAIYYPDSEEDAGALRASIEHCLVGVTDLQSIERDELGAAQAEFQVEWAGTFEQLLSGSGDLARDIRSDFRDEYSPKSIDDSDHGKFVRFLASLSG